MWGSVPSSLFRWLVSLAPSYGVFLGAIQLKVGIQSTIGAHQEE